MANKRKQKETKHIEAINLTPQERLFHFIKNLGLSDAQLTEFYNILSDMKCTKESNT